MKRLVGSLALIFLCASLAMAGGLLGDLNSDGVVDFDDFFIFAQQFGKKGEPFHPDTVRVTVRDTIRVTIHDTIRVTTPPPSVPGTDKTVLVTTAAGDRLEIVQRLLEKTRITFMTENGLSVMSPDGSQQVRVSTRNVWWADWRSDGAKLCYHTEDGNNTGTIYLINPDGSGEKRVTNGFHPSWSPDGSTILFYRYVSGFLPTWFTVKADGTGERVLTGVNGALWSPNGRLTVGVADTTSLHVYLINPDGTGQKSLGTFQSGLDSPSWSPDGGKMVFSYQGGIYTINTDGSGQRRLTDTDSDGYARWSPDGNTLAIVEGLSRGQQTLSTIKVDGSGKQQVLKENIDRLVWSPDGSKILLDTGSALKMINPDGTNPVTVVQVDVRYVFWSPFTP